VQNPKSNRREFVILKVEVPRQLVVDQIDAGNTLRLYRRFGLRVVSGALRRRLFLLLLQLRLLLLYEQVCEVVPGFSQLL
jgi:hypothetical protein